MLHYIVYDMSTLYHTISNTYNYFGQIINKIDENGLITRYEYDDFGNKIKEIQANGIETTYEYEYDNSYGALYKITTKQNSLFPKITYVNKLNQIIKTITLDFNGDEVYIDTTYDDFGNIIEQTNSHTLDEIPVYTKLIYDEYNRVIKKQIVINNESKTLEDISYDNLTTTVINVKGQSKITTKDIIGNIIYIEESNTTQEYKYDANNQLIKTIDSNNNEIILKYDKYGNKIYQSDPDMGIYTYEYNALGQIVKQTDPANQIITYVYDKLGRKIRENIDGKISTWEYDTNKLGFLSKEEKDNYKRVYTYDDLSRLIQTSTTIDNNTFTKSFTYDELGRLKTKTLPNNFSIINTYNQYGYLESIKSPKEQIKDFDENYFTSLINANISFTKTSESSNIEILQQIQELTLRKIRYEDISNLYINHPRIMKYYVGKASKMKFVKMRFYRLTKNASKKESYFKNKIKIYKNLAEEYKTKNQNIYNRFVKKYEAYTKALYQLNQRFLIKEIIDEEIKNNDSVNITDRYTFEEIINKYQQKSLDMENSILILQKQLMTIDKVSKIQENLKPIYQTISDDNAYNYFYKVISQDSQNRVTSYLTGNGLVSDNNYSDVGTLIYSTTRFNDKSYIRKLTYEYDNLYNVIYKKDHKLNLTQNFRYDNLNRITKAYIDTNTSSSTIEYRYDRLGNIVYKSDIGDYQYDTVHPHQVKSVGDKIFTYDILGNMIKSNNKTITYTAFNKTQTITNGLNITTFKYDTNQYRYKKITKNQDTYYIDKDYEHSNFKNNDTQEKYFIYVNNKVISIYKNNNVNNTTISNTSYLYHDSLGSIDIITNNKAKVLQRVAYKPFGEQINFFADGSIKPRSNINRGYTGHETIEEENLINMNARLYDPSIGRFLSADTLIPDQYSSQDFNRYSYVLNNPLKYTDPSGHQLTQHQIDSYGWERVEELASYIKKKNHGDSKIGIYLVRLFLYKKEVNYNTQYNGLVTETLLNEEDYNPYDETHRRFSGLFSSSGTWTKNDINRWNKNRNTLNKLPRALGGDGGISNSTALRNDRYVGYLFSAGGGIGLSSVGLNSLGIGANYLRANPNYVINTTSLISGYYTKTPSNNLYQYTGRTIKLIENLVK